MNVMNKSKLAIAVLLSIIAANSSALTFKSGQVIGSDGKAYDGISPQNEANLLRSGSEKTVGVINNSLYVIVNDEVVTIPLKELAKVDSEDRTSTVIELVKSEYREKLRERITQASNADQLSDSIREKGLENSIKSEELADSVNYSDKQFDKILKSEEGVFDQAVKGQISIIEGTLEEQESDIQRAVQMQELAIESALKVHELGIETILKAQELVIESALKEQESAIEDALMDPKSVIENVPGGAGMEFPPELPPVPK